MGSSVRETNRGEMSTPVTQSVQFPQWTWYVLFVPTCDQSDQGLGYGNRGSDSRGVKTNLPVGRFNP